MKYKVTLNGRTYEIEVEAGQAICLDEYEAIAPAAPAAPQAQSFSTASADDFSSVEMDDELPF